jgi:ABC-2 type transport system permease protein
MKGLLLKEWLMVKKQIVLYPLLAALYIIIDNETDTNISGVLLNIIAISVPMMLLQLDEQTKWDTFINTAPVSRKNIIGAKYIFVLLVISIIGIAIMIVDLILGKGKITMRFITVCLSFFTSILIMSGSFLIGVKFGTSKGRIMFLITVAVIVFVGIGLTTMLSFNGGFNVPMNKYVLLTCVILICALISYGLYRRTVKLYSAKEF